MKNRAENKGKNKITELHIGGAFMSGLIRETEQPGMTLETCFRDYLQSLLDCDPLSASKAIDGALNRFRPEEIVEMIITPALYKLGELWSRGEAALTQVCAAAIITDRAMDKLSPYIKSQRQVRCKAVIGSLDSHGFGKNIVIRFLKAGGIEVTDLGIGVSPKTFVDVALESKADVILVSALMFHTSLLVGEIRSLLEKRGLKIPLIVGGAPFSFDENLYRRVGADAMCRNMGQLVVTIEELVEK